jgi:hypothetical protein
MKSLADIVHFKRLIESGFDRTVMTKLVSQGQTFADVIKSKGHAIQYSYRHVMLIAIGCRLSDLGVSFRHIDIVLMQLKTIFSKDYDFKDDIMLLSRIGNMKREVKIGNIRLDVAYMADKRKVKTIILEPFLMNKRDFMEMVNYSEKIGYFLVIDLQDIKDSVNRVFE